jgi:hypothetical protein
MIMSNIILTKDTHEIKKVDSSEILHYLYFKLYFIPDLSEIDMYNKKFNTNYQSEEIKKIISSISTQIPLFDILSQNIYLINEEEVYYYVKDKHYRLPTLDVLEFLEMYNSKIESKKYKKLLHKNIVFLKNYNFDILFDTYLHVIYKNSNQIGKNITFCQRPSFLQYSSNNPYYTRSEIINLALNLNIIKPDKTIYDEDKIKSLCKIVEENDINAKTILSHQIYIQKNNAQHIIYYYTFYGSLYYNRYIRSDSIYDTYLDSKINDLFTLIKYSPKFEKEYVVYRLVSSDDYLRDVKVNSIYKEESFISTSRNPFYEPKNNVFGTILLKIRLPKNKMGIGLCLENYSLFPKEQEILLSPGKLKLISIDNSFKYYHPDIKAQRSITKKYEFEYIEPLDEIKMKPTYNKEHIIEPLPDNFTLISTDLNDKLIEFYRTVPIVNDMHYFNYTIENKTYIFQVFYLEKVIAYYKYFFLQQKEKQKDEINIIFLVLQDDKTHEIKLIVEIGEIISANYLHKFTGSKSISDTEILTIVKSLEILFKLDRSIIHPRYSKYNKTNSVPNIEKYVNNYLVNYYNEDIIDFSKDLKFYNEDIWNYLTRKSIRFNTEEIKNDEVYSIINKNNVYSLDSLRRIPYNLILKETDNDELYKYYTKNKINSIYDFLLFLHENQFNYIPLLLDKLTKSKILKINPFTEGYYIVTNNQKNNNIEDIDKYIKEEDIDERYSRDD